MAHIPIGGTRGGMSDTKEGKTVKGFKIPLHDLIGGGDGRDDSGGEDPREAEPYGTPQHAAPMTLFL